jgi:hypothetical protein
MLEQDQAKGVQLDEGFLRAMSSITDRSVLRPRLIHNLRCAFSEFLSAPSYGRDTTGSSELKFTTLITWDGVPGSSDDGARIFTHVSEMGAPPPAPIKVQIVGRPRSNAAAKDSDWVRERIALEAAKPSDVNEILLVDSGGGDCSSGGGSILEGTQTNFFAVTPDGTVCTAPDGTVLAGTVRNLVLDVCRQEGIPVRMEAPEVTFSPGTGLGSSVSEITWSEAFITSTSRLVLPVNQVVTSTSSPDQPYSVVKGFEYTSESVVSRISRGVHEGMAAVSVDVMA